MGYLDYTVHEIGRKFSILYIVIRPSTQDLDEVPRNIH